MNARDMEPRNAYTEERAKHQSTGQQNAQGRTLCTCGKPISHRHIAAVCSRAQRLADQQAARNVPGGAS